MPHRSRISVGDVELGKRDDDHKPGSKRPWALDSNGLVLFPRWLVTPRNLRRMAIGVALVLGLYYFFKNMPTDLGPRTQRPSYSHQRTPGGRNRWDAPPPLPPTATQNTSNKNGPVEHPRIEAESKHWFNGPIKFYELASSLHAISTSRSLAWNNQNVLFAASNPKGAAVLLQLACEMASLRRNYVHFAFMGREDISMELLREINGLKDECGILFHDARPDFLLESSDYRMEVSCAAALGHINNYMSPQAILIDNSGVEDPFFLKALRERAPALGKTLIELPSNAEQSLRWITKLDSSSLNSWNKISIDIAIHAQPAASGSLIRLLGSLKSADYFQSSPPHLTIELPNKIDEPTKRFLGEFKWPPSSHPIEASANQLHLRHRIPQPGLTPEESSTRFLESFWPIDPATSHILVLSPQVELSPLFFHYLKYVILEYKYSSYADLDSYLLGISLDMPSTFLNDTLPFSPPNGTSNPFFLWQAPNSAAALYFGDKWTELHTFISHSLASKQKLPTPTTFQEKQVSKTKPSWLEQILSLARARGYYTLYPHLATESSLATIHNELYVPPEEFSNLDDQDPAAPRETNTDFTADPEHHLSLKHVEKPLASASLLSILPTNGTLPSLMNMPLLTWEGKLVSRIEMEETASMYSQVFRNEIGGCSTSDKHKSRVKGSAEDLFCIKAEE